MWSCGDYVPIFWFLHRTSYMCWHPTNLGYFPFSRTEMTVFHQFHNNLPTKGCYDEQIQYKETSFWWWCLSLRRDELYTLIHSFLFHGTSILHYIYIYIYIYIYNISWIIRNLYSHHRSCRFVPGEIWSWGVLRWAQVAPWSIHPSIATSPGVVSSNGFCLFSPHLWDETLEPYPYFLCRNDPCIDFRTLSSVSEVLWGLWQTSLYET